MYYETFNPYGYGYNVNETPTNDTANRFSGVLSQLQNLSSQFHMIHPNQIKQTLTNLLCEVDKLQIEDVGGKAGSAFKNLLKAARNLVSAGASTSAYTNDGLFKKIGPFYVPRYAKDAIDLGIKVGADVVKALF